MSFLYRHALFVSRKAPYLAWANGTSDDGSFVTEELSRQQRTVYLVPEGDGEPDVEALLEEFWEHIFEEELSAWVMSEEQWPQERTRALFDEWFDVEANAAVYDLTPEEPLTQRQVDAEDLEEALGYCAACGIEVEPGAGRFAGFKLADRARFEMFQGRVLPLNVDDDATVLCIVTTEDSEEARAGDDVLVRVCSSGCEKAIRKTVPRALKRLIREIPDVT